MICKDCAKVAVRLCVWITLNWRKMLLVTDKERKKGVIGLTNIGFIRFIEENHGFTAM